MIYVIADSMCANWIEREVVVERRSASSVRAAARRPGSETGTTTTISPGRATAGEAAPDDPDQLVIAIMACLDGLGRFTLAYPGQAPEHFPAAAIITRMLQPPQPQGEPRPGAGPP